MLNKTAKYVTIVFLILIVVVYIFSLMDVNISPYGGAVGAVILVLGVLMVGLLLLDFVSQAIRNKSMFTAQSIMNIVVESAAVSLFTFFALYWLKGEKEYYYVIFLGIIWAMSTTKLRMKENEKH